VEAIAWKSLAAWSAPRADVLLIVGWASARVTDGELRRPRMWSGAAR